MPAIAIQDGVMFARAVLRSQSVTEFNTPVLTRDGRLTCSNCDEPCEWVIRKDFFQGFCDACGGGFEVFEVWCDPRG